jgi:hypothetical protein
MIQMNIIKNEHITYSKAYRNSLKPLTTIPNNILDLINTDFIFIVDMPDLRGGACFFLDVIISHFKKQALFIIAKHINNSMHIIINNEYKLENNYNVSESIEFIDKYKDKITKIFFNHTLDHNKEFIQKLFTLGKHTTYITHDYYLLCNKPQACHYEIPTKSTNYLDINKFDKVITQHEVNLAIFRNYYGRNIDVVGLPDFNKSVTTRVDTPILNGQIIVGIIGNIGPHKGKEILEKIVAFFKSDVNIKIVVFGCVEIPGFNNYFPYDNIGELNVLLLQYKPNILLELSLWPETYSYTLTLAMLTGLPILCLKKKFASVVENRLSKYQKVLYFTNYSNLSGLIYAHKQEYLFTIDDTIYFDQQWIDYFSPASVVERKNIWFKNMAHKNIVLVTSKIKVTNHPFSYVKKRSFYSVQERMVQTIQTIRSIRKYIPDSYIVLLDNSVFNPFEYKLLETLTDTFMNITNDLVLNYFTDVFEYKAFGEISQQITFLSLFLKEDLSCIQNFFKITGRYELNEQFDYSKYDNRENIFKRHLSIKDKEYYYTCFYKLDKSILAEVYDIFGAFVKNKEKYMNNYSDLEVIFPNAIIDKITLIDTLGVIENIGVWKKITHI